MIQLELIRRIVGAMLMVFGVTMLPPMAISVLYSDGKWPVFFWLMVIALAVGYLLFRNTPKQREPKTRDGVIAVVLIWFGFSFIGAFPLYWALDIGFVNALFEATSGLSTTGATVLHGLDQLPKSILWYRQQLHFFGGMGVIVLAVAILPLLNVGGMQLYRTEATGPKKEDKLAPRIAQTARVLFTVYLSLTVVVALAFWLSGMNGFDAITHAMSAIATGGFANYDASFGHFNSLAIELVAQFAMVAGAMNFGLHYSVWHSRELGSYLNDQESRTFFGILLFAIALTTLVLWLHHDVDSIFDGLRRASFTVIAIMTGTGFGITDFHLWPHFLPVMLIFISYVGGCAGSTTGGLKVMRVFLLFKQASREAKRLVQPNIVAHIKFNGRIVPEQIAKGVWGFLVLYVMTAASLTLLMILAGLEPLTAFSAVAASLNNLGPGLNEIASTSHAVSDFGKLVMSFAMITGRLEILTIFVLFTPIFWRRF
ncbi:TrkH family potassium uptake protein [Permianibacter aggregans]|uniref:Trk system potassium uptake protein n=1 Tax=Permianibacter aggregans TaxID=1510150 RepID=A0A4R6UUF5_9GAMM|nr:TrkH family potassium uptake protein [Permianibacter aggregans]TDQ49896.1 trk system potassium uptake protein TrkH [Permianibacter aggregans]